MHKIFVVFAVILIGTARTSSIYLKLSTIYITDLQFTKCDTRSFDPVSIENVTINIGNNKHFHISGSLNTSEDLVSPVKASVTLKKKTWIGWIPIPCEKKMGSCDYMDLCTYGYPEDKDCPPEFVANGIPCRCPIKKGNYTLPPSQFQFTDDKDVLSGKYKGNVLVSHLNSQLACYNMNFIIKEQQITFNHIQV